MRHAAARLALVLLLGFLAACSGGGGGGSSPVAPSISAQPASLTVVQGQSATFSVTAAGTAPLAYQWRKGGGALPGGTAALLTIASAQAADAGTYDVVVSNAAGAATSAGATLTVNLPPAITVQPAAQVVLAPARATFSVTATGTAPLAYQWKRNGADLAGATGPAYETPATGAADDGAVYSVSVSNAAGTLASTGALLTVHLAAAVTVQPQAQAVVAPAPATFAVTATGTAPLAYQWKRNGTPLPGATASVLSTGATTAADHGAVYAVTVANAYGTDTSTGAALTVNLPPAITTHPLSQSVIAPGTATFTVVATGTAPLAYQWKRNGTDIPGAVTAAYTTPATTLADNAAVFSVTVTSPYGSAPSNGAVLTVTSAPVAPSITVPPASLTVTAPAPAAFTVTAAGTPPLAYQWKRGGAAIPGATGTTYALPSTVYGDDGAQFSVTVTNAVSSATSAAATLTVRSVPVITVQPASATVTAPATATFSVAATGTPPFTYQWRKGAADIGGAVASSYTTPATVVGDSGSTYAVTVTNAYGSTPSSAATLTVNPPAALDLSIPTVYITQSTQTQAFGVPLVKDRAGYLRAFVVANQANSAAPDVRVRIYDAASTLVWSTTITAPGASVPTAVDESSLAASWNAAVPGAAIQPGYRLAVDVDPANAIAESNEANNIWPSGGTPQALDVRTLPTLNVRFFSVQTSDGRSGNIAAGTMGAYTALLEKLWPIAGITRDWGGTFTAPYTLASTGTNWSQVLSLLSTKRVADGWGGHYYGVVNPSYTLTTGGVAGLGQWPGRTAIGWDAQPGSGYLDSGLMSGVYAHEVGHNFSLGHAPCSVTGDDPSYPYAGGLIGAWGLDVASPALKNPGTYRDIMGYCNTVWISDYNYKIALAYRVASGFLRVEPAAADGCLLLWGRLEDGEAVLEPAFHMAVAPLPPEPGSHLLEGFDASGAKVFSTPFEPSRVADLPEGRSAAHFAFSVPLARADAARLADLRWTRAGQPLARQGRPGGAILGTAQPAWEPMLQPLPDGRTRLLWDAAAHPMVMVRDRATGMVLGFGVGGDFRFAAEAEDLDLHFSDGVQSRPLGVRRPRLGD